MIRRPPRSTRTDNTLSLHDALPISTILPGPHLPLNRKIPRWNGIHVVDVHELEAVACAHHAAREEPPGRSEEHTSELQSLMRISYAVFCLKKKTSPFLQFNTRL